MTVVTDQPTKMPANVVFGFNIGESFWCGQSVTQIYHGKTDRSYNIKTPHVRDLVDSSADTVADFELWLAGVRY
jgi:hypothetical protein